LGSEESWKEITSLAANRLSNAIEDRTAHDLVIQATDVGVCPNKLNPRVLHEWREPRHEAFQPRNVWSLFRAFARTVAADSQANCIRGNEL
jgi:hypothetical protein